MNNEVVKAEQFGLEENQANEITKGLKAIIDEREALINSYHDVIELEITEENLPVFKELRLMIRDNRTKGIEVWHKKNKEFYLRGGQFVDAIKNKEIEVNKGMETKLMDAEKYFENLEKQRIEELNKKRISLISEYVEDADKLFLADMDEDVWEAYLSTKKANHEAKIEAERKAEEERLAKIKAEKEEQERIRLENEKLKKQAEERERLAKIEEEKRAKAEEERKAKEDAERKKREEKERKEREAYEAKLKAEREEREKIARELKAKEEAERKAKEDAEAKLQAELSKGDAAKVKDLINDLTVIKTKYSFKSAKNKKIYKEVSVLIDKVINHIEK